MSPPAFSTPVDSFECPGGRMSGTTTLRMPIISRQGISATQLLTAGVHPKVVSERLGHASIGITLDVYSHVLPSMQEEAADKIDAGLREVLAG